MPAFMKYQGVDGSSHEGHGDYIEVVSYSPGNPQAAPDIRKGSWVLDGTPEPSAGADGSSNTIMVGEILPTGGDYVLTFVEHTGRLPLTELGLVDDLFVFNEVSSGTADAHGGEDSRGLWQINAEPTDALGEPVTFTATVTFVHGAVGTETLTIAHEGLLLL